MKQMVIQLQQMYLSGDKRSLSDENVMLFKMLFKDQPMSPISPNKMGTSGKKEFDPSSFMGQDIHGGDPSSRVSIATEEDFKLFDKNLNNKKNGKQKLNKLNRSQNQIRLGTKS